MQKAKTRLVFKMVTLVVVFTLLMPTAVKFTHIFNHHKHEICNNEIETHLHNADFDCSFYEFKLSTPYTIPSFDFVFVTIEDNHQTFDASYSFLSEFQRLHFLRRGPPQMI